MVARKDINMLGALIGFGTIASGHFSAYQQIQDASIIAVVDPVLERRNKAKTLDKNLQVYKTIGSLFSQENVEFIDICSPPHTHLDYIRIGLKNGCHLLCEKPFLTSVRDYKGILSLTKRAGKTLYPCHNYKFSPILKQIYSRVHSKNFGQVVNAHFRVLRSGHAVGVPEWNPHWRRNQNISSGGILRDHGTHSIYIATHLSGSMPIAVSCLIGNLRKDNYTENEDTALLTLYFKKSRYFTIDLSWAANFRYTYYSVTGTKEMVTVENDEISFTTPSGKLVREIIPSEFNDPTHKAWFVDVIHDFLDTVKSPNRQVPLLNEALMTTLVIEKAYESARLGGVKLDLPQLSKNML